MCGITAIFSSTADLETSQIKAMTDRIVHRGPDDEGFAGYNSQTRDHQTFIGQDSKVEGIPIDDASGQYNLLFGHRRLSILDLSPAGHQPMTLGSKLSIIFNGEIFNFLELRETLSLAGYEFKTNTDTEIVLAAYDHWGEECLNRFNGMWAFIILDKGKNELFISRDRFGIKPLYYIQTKDNLSFASEIKCFFELPFFQPKPNLSYLQDYLKNGPREYLEDTAFSGVKRIPAGSFVRINLDEKPSQTLNFRKFYLLKVNLEKTSFDPQRSKQFQTRYLELLKSSVDLRLRADVRVGSALSGGLDSSSVVFWINKSLKDMNKEEIQETFSCIHKTKGAEYCDESPFIDLLTENLKVKSNRIEPPVPEIPEQHRKMIYHMDTPPEGMMMSSWFIYKLVRESGVTVTMDGQGADEQMGGYLRYLVNFLGQLKGDLKLQTMAYSRIPGTEKFIKTGKRANFVKRYLPMFLVRGMLKLIGKENPKTLMTLNERMWADMNTNIVNLLHYLDRNSMAHSVESRTPYMDYRLMEFSFSIPDVFKMHNGWTKYLPRQAMTDRLPEEVCWREDKMGWPNPHEFWLNGPLKQWAIDIVKKSKFLAEIGAEQDLGKLIDEKRPVFEVVRLINLAIWHEVFFENKGAPVA